MHAKNAEIYIIILIGCLLAILLVGFIVAILFLYQRKQHRQEKQLAFLKDQYDRELLQSQLEIQESTLKTIAQELHDNIGQVLSVVKLSLSILPIGKTDPAYESVQNCYAMLNKVIYDMADLTKSLHTDRIAQIGIVEAIRFELDNIRKSGLLKVDFSVSGDEQPVDEQKGIFLFRMFQEMLNNILKHAEATYVIVSIIYTIDNTFVLKVQDNGIGFNAEKKQAQVSSSSGLGLKSLKNRAQLIGADVSIQSEPGKGTLIMIELLLEPETALMDYENDN
jgi:two-component system NarL family sensor kinase